MPEYYQPYVFGLSSLFFIISGIHSLLVVDKNPYWTVANCAIPVVSCISNYYKHDSEVWLSIDYLTIFAIVTSFMDSHFFYIAGMLEMLLTKGEFQITKTVVVILSNAKLFCWLSGKYDIALVIALYTVTMCCYFVRQMNLTDGEYLYWNAGWHIGLTVILYFATEYLARP